MLNAFREPGVWLKGNLHTHSTKSDGRISPEDRITAYADNNYDFLAITDHDLTEEYHDERLTMIIGSEWIIPLGDRWYHLVALDVPSGFQLPEKNDMQKAIDAVRAAGGLAVLAHPYWSGLTLPDLQQIEGYFALEVFNSTTQFEIAKGTSAVHWDNYLAAGGRCWGVAVDDCHFAEDAFGGWIMIKAEETSSAAIMRAIKAGKFYASTGPVIHNIQKEDTRLVVDCSDAKAIHFICRHSTGRRVTAPDGELLNHAEFQLEDFFGYVRVEVIDSEGKTAWSNPLFLQ